MELRDSYIIKVLQADEDLELALIYLPDYPDLVKENIERVRGFLDELIGMFPRDPEVQKLAETITKGCDVAGFESWLNGTAKMICKAHKGDSNG